MSKSAVLGLGLISIGRSWGCKPSAPPSQDHTNRLLRRALELGIRFFDTAPAYGTSEEHLGRFLRTLTPDQLDSVTVATKCGVHWDFEHSRDLVDHSYHALCQSIDTSLRLLPKVDVIQIHKATVDVLQSKAVYRALEYALSNGIRFAGASVKDIPAARIAAASEWFSFLQFPYNTNAVFMDEAFTLSRTNEKQVLVNRPFGEGTLLHDHDGTLRGTHGIHDAFAFILTNHFKGCVLSGTQSLEHLEENVAGFEAASRNSK